MSLLQPGTKKRMLLKQLESCSSSTSSSIHNDNDSDNDNARDETDGSRLPSKSTSKSRCRWAKNHPQNDAVVRVCHGRDEWREALLEGEASSSSSSFKNDDNNSSDEHKHELEHEPELSIVSWNTLSDTWYEQGATTTNNTTHTTIYDHTPRECGVWEGRFPLLLEWISSLRPDVLALQEVDYERFESELLPELARRKFGYDGMIQHSKQKKKNKSKQHQQQQQQPCGVATFWCSDKLELLDHRVGSRSLATRFRFKRQRRNSSNGASASVAFTVVNVHLESPYRFGGHRRSCNDVDHCYEKKRTGQLDSPLRWAAATTTASGSIPLVLCGDFNAGAESTLFRALLVRERTSHATKTATRTQRERQQEQQRHRQSRCWHGHDLCSVYEHPSALGALPVATTFCLPNHHCAIDHVLYTHDTATLRAVLDPLTQSERNEQLGKTTASGGNDSNGNGSNGNGSTDDDDNGNDLERGFPNKFCPSDHLPIGALFTLRHQPAAAATTAAIEIETNSVRQPCKDDDIDIDHDDQRASMETALDSALRNNKFKLLPFDNVRVRDNDNVRDETPLDLDSLFANGCRDELIRLLTEKLAVEFGCCSTSTMPALSNVGVDANETIERRRNRVAKCVKKRIGKEYGRWKFGQKPQTTMNDERLRGTRTPTLHFNGN